MPASRKPISRLDSSRFLGQGRLRTHRPGLRICGTAGASRAAAHVRAWSGRRKPPISHTPPPPRRERQRQPRGTPRPWRRRRGRRGACPSSSGDASRSRSACSFSSARPGGYVERYQSVFAFEMPARAASRRRRVERLAKTRRFRRAQLAGQFSIELALFNRHQGVAFQWGGIVGCFAALSVFGASPAGRAEDAARRPRLREDLKRACRRRRNLSGDGLVEFRLRRRRPNVFRF